MTLMRSMLFVPGYKLSFLEKARSLGSDALILDLEDSVPVAFKKDARKNIQEFLNKTFHKNKIFVRLNSVFSGLLSEDLSHVLNENVYGFMPSMIRDEMDMVYIDKLLTQLEYDNGFAEGKFKLCPLIETGSAVLKCYEIAKSSSRVIGLAFGAEDNAITCPKKVPEANMLTFLLKSLKLAVLKNRT